MNLFVSKRRAAQLYGGVLSALLMTGCAGAGNPMAGIWPGQKSPEENAQAMMAAQQAQARRASSGEESSIYPAVMAEDVDLPRTEADLKNPLQLHLSYARLQEQIGHLTEAKSSYEKVISKEPKSVEALIGLGRIDALAGRHQQAEEHFQSAVNFSGASAEALYAYGKYLDEQKRYPEAIVQLQKSAAAQPANQQYQFELGLTLARAEQFQEAHRRLASVVGEAEAYYNIGYVAMKDLNQKKTADRYFSTALEYDVDLPQARYWLTELRKQHASQIMMASGQNEQKPNVINAVESRSSNHQEKRHVYQAGTTRTAELDHLTPEQREQWANQIR